MWILYDFALTQYLNNIDNVFYDLIAFKLQDMKYNHVHVGVEYKEYNTEWK